jgi:hypothetical protein
MKHDEKVLNIIKEVAEEHGVEYEVALDAYESLFIYTKKLLKRKDLPVVLWHRFGSFKTTKQKVYAFILKKFRLFNEGLISRHNMVQYLKQFYPAIERLRVQDKTNFYKLRTWYKYFIEQREQNGKKISNNVRSLRRSKDSSEPSGDMAGGES